MARREGLQPPGPSAGSGGVSPAALINSSVELIVHPDAHDVVCEMRVRRYGSPRHWTRREWGDSVERRRLYFQKETLPSVAMFALCQLEEVAMSAFGGTGVQNPQIKLKSP